ncbi:MAG: 4Fe-4S dicluster domain-containing protein, partial [Gemmatimonadota bacterium]
QERRERLLIVSVDCARITEHCFCHMVGNAPVVEKGMGINLTPVADGFVARADTPEGQAGLDAAGLRAPVTPEHRAQAAATEERTRQELEESNERFSWNGSSFHGLLGGEVSPDAWNDLFASCVECGSCTSLCPTCYCFYMVDRSRSGAPPAAYEKLRSWDSCLLSDYSRMAGGDGMKPTPRPRLRSRYENRLRHKFQYFHETHGQYGCTGCGRCSAACSATADPREVMRVLAQ